MKRIFSVLLSLVIVATMLTGLDLCTYAEDMVTLRIESKVTNASDDVNFIYYVLIDGEAYTAEAVGTKTYQLVDGVLEIPSTESVDIKIPLGASYIVCRSEFAQDGYAEIPDPVLIEGVANPYVYTETAGSLASDIGANLPENENAAKEITEEEFNTATNYGENLVVPYYFYYKDRNNNDLVTKHTADEVELCPPVTLASGNIYRLKSEKKNSKWATLSLTSSTQVTTLGSRKNYSIKGDAEIVINMVDKKMAYATIISDSFEKARDKAVENSRASFKTALISAANDAFTDETKSVAASFDVNEIITADLFTEANSGGNILKTTGGTLFEFSPYISRTYTYEMKPKQGAYTVVFEGELHKHEYSPVVTAPTCQDKGYTTYTCSCGESYIDDYTDFSGHDYSIKEVITPATCTQEGENKLTCSICGETKIELVEAIAHTPEAVSEIAATCTATGLTEGSKCSACGKILNEQMVVDALGHNYATTKATLAKNGVVKCTKCGAVKQNIAYPKTIKLSATSYTYDGKAKKPTVKVTDSKGKAIAASNYTVTYASGRKNVGRYAVKITFKGNYSGTKTLYFTIVPKGTTIASIAPASKAMTVKWKKQATQTTGYQIQYSTDKNFKKGNKTVTVGSNKTVSKKITKLTGKKKYYVRIRTYKTVSGTKYYSTWSKAKAVTIKK